MTRKNQLIKEFQAHARRLNENMDYDSKVLQDRARAIVLGLFSEEQLAKAIQNDLSQ